MDYHYLLSALILTLIIPLWGILIYFLNKLVYGLLAKGISQKFAMTVVNWLTIPGVIHHECSHAFFAKLTGAIITEFRPFWPDKTTGSLGHVNFATRGSVLMRCIQCTLTATAPVILGTISSIALFAVTRRVALPIYVIILIAYLIFSIMIHASMSFADVKVMLKGIWALYIGMFVFCLYAQLDLVKMLIP